MTLPPVIEPGYLTVGVDASPPPPMQIGDPATPEFDGYEVDLVREIARRVGLGLRFRSAIWSAILADLEAGLLDLVCTAATDTDSRRSRYLVGRPYLDLDLVAVTRADSPISTVDDLPRAAYVVRRATVAEDYVRRRLEPTRVILTEFNDEAYDVLDSGRVDALIDDEPIAGWFVEQRPSLRILASLPNTRSHYAMIFARGSGALAATIDTVMLEAIADGTLARLQSRWFGGSARPSA